MSSLSLESRLDRVELALGRSSLANAAPLSQRVRALEAQLAKLPFATRAYADAVQSVRSARVAVSNDAPDANARATLLAAALDELRIAATHAESVAACRSFLNDASFEQLVAARAGASSLPLPPVAEVAAQTAALDALLQSHAAVCDALAEQFYSLDAQLSLLEREHAAARRSASGGE